MSGRMLVGWIRKPHGMHGEVSVEPATDFPAERFATGSAMRGSAAGNSRELRVESSRSHFGRLLVRFVGVTSIEEARGLAGCELTVPESERFEAPEDFFFSDDLAGWPCRLPDGQPAGQAVRLERGDAGSYLVLARAGREHLVPFTRPIIIRVDPERREIWIDPPAGLWELQR
jgi:16S rRNA processing protein RimM